MARAEARAYRSKIEVLRDFLKAATAPAPKTRIIGAANLNPTSFRRYLQVCTERALITSVSGGYVTTPNALPLLAAIDGLMVKQEELNRAFRALGEQGVPASARSRPPDSAPFRHVLREAWNEVLLRPPAESAAEGRRPGVYAPAEPPNNATAGVAPAAASPTLRTGRAPVQGRSSSLPRRSPPRAPRDRRLRAPKQSLRSDRQ